MECMQRTSGVRVLFAGQYWPGANTVYIARAFERSGAIVRMLNDSAIYPDWRHPISRAARRLLLPAIEAEWNRQLLDLADSFKPDLIYITNADLCRPRTLEAIRQASIPVMCFCHDVQWKDRAGTRFAENLPHFDLVATTRRWHKAEFQAARAKAVRVVRFGYDPAAHRPLAIDAATIERYGCDVAFIGTYEPHRAAELNALLSSDFPYSFRLWGGFWKRQAHWQGREVQESEIPVIYAAAKTALHWVGWEPNGADAALRKGDGHNSRTFQIAACGGAMMLAQRTEEHLRFFAEDREAVYFDNVRELRSKLDYWLDPARDDRRRGIAAAARARCIAEDYSYVPVVRTFLDFFRLGCNASHNGSERDGTRARDASKHMQRQEISRTTAATGPETPARAVAKAMAEWA